jgi:hypothetical protein
MKLLIIETFKTSRTNRDKDAQAHTNQTAETVFSRCKATAEIFSRGNEAPVCHEASAGSKSYAFVNDKTVLDEEDWT